MSAVAWLFVLLSLGYLLVMFGLSRRRRETKDDDPAVAAPCYVFVVPCLDEELVIRNTLDSLLRLPAHRTQVVVVDDDSSDGTAEVVRSYPTTRVTLLQRRRPAARQGKGEALNAAYRFIRDHVAPDTDVVVGIVDADGRIEPDLLDHVDPFFRDERVGAVQILVRILNRHGMLTRFQDFEFCCFAQILQTGREHLGSVGLGGNGQFTRLAALRDLGESPWTDCLTEDLDLGLRLALQGWHNRFTGRTWVSQQGPEKLVPLVRQRTRWLHGHLQCWRHVPAIVRSTLPNRTMLDLVYYLLAPAFTLTASALFIVPMVGLPLLAMRDGVDLVAAWPYLLVWYLLSFGPALLLGLVYWRKSGDYRLVPSLVLAHLVLLYNAIWYVAGLRVLGRLVTRRRGWAKTARVAEQPVAAGAVSR